jgi:hypothetical protein
LVSTRIIEGSRCPLIILTEIEELKIGQYVRKKILQQSRKKRTDFHSQRVHPTGGEFTSQFALVRMLLPTRYWFEFVRGGQATDSLSLGCGITAYNLDDAGRMLRQEVFPLYGDRAVARVIEAWKPPALTRPGRACVGAARSDLGQCQAFPL